MELLLFALRRDLALLLCCIPQSILFDERNAVHGQLEVILVAIIGEKILFTAQIVAV